MAIRGIDAQILITKSTEYAAEQAKMLRQHEQIADQAARQAQRQASLDRTRAQAAANVKGARVSPDNEGGSGAFYDASPGKGGRSGARGKAGTGQRDSMLNLPVEPGEYKIDIIV